MKHCEASTPRTAFAPSLALLMLSVCLLSSALVAGKDATSKKDPPPNSPSAKPAKKPQKKLNGAELYALHCNRCHPERYATERTAEQWKTILLHMRTRASLPAGQARAILLFLQEDSGK